MFNYIRFHGIPCFPKARVLEKHLSGYDEADYISSRYDAASKLAPVSPVPVEQKV